MKKNIFSIFVAVIFTSVLTACGGGGGGTSGTPTPTPSPTTVTVTCPNGTSKTAATLDQANALCPLPVMLASSPASGATGVSVDTFTGIDVTTDSAIDATSVITANIVLKSGSNAISGIATAVGTKNFKFTPNAKLNYGQNYTFAAAVKDTLGRTLLVNSSFTAVGITVTTNESNPVTVAFSKSLNNTDIETVFGISKKPTSFTGTTLGFGIQAKTGDTIGAISVIRKIAMTIDKDALYSFALDSRISSKWRYLDSSSVERSKLILDGNPITNALPAPGTTYPSYNNTIPITVYDQKWYNSQGDWVGTGGYGPILITLPGSELNRLSFYVGNELLSNVFILAPPDGNFTLRFIRDFYVDQSPNFTTATEYVDALIAFGTRFSGTAAPHGCTEITQIVSTSAGAPIPTNIWHVVPKDNPQRGGHWTAIYESDSMQVPDWGSLLQPGDVVNLVLRGGSQHTFSVITASGQTVETVDNTSSQGIGRHATNFEMGSRQNSVTIYRLDGSYSAPAFRVFDWLESLYTNLLSGKPATQEINGYLVRQYSSGWAIGTKDGRLYVLRGDSKVAFDVGPLDNYLSIANLNGY